jgi:hypothetical protein
MTVTTATCKLKYIEVLSLLVHRSREAKDIENLLSEMGRMHDQTANLFDHEHVWNSYQAFVLMECRKIREKISFVRKLKSGGSFISLVFILCEGNCSRYHMCTKVVINHFSRAGGQEEIAATESSSEPPCLRDEHGETDNYSCEHSGL